MNENENRDDEKNQSSLNENEDFENVEEEIQQTALSQEEISEIHAEGSDAKKEMIKNEIISWVKTIVFAFAIAFVLKTYVFQIAYAKSISMEPTLHEGQVLIISNIHYLVGQPHRGDIVVIDKAEDQLDNKTLIKRVIGEPGETVEIKDNKVYINDKELNPDYTTTPTPDFGFERTTIPSDKYMVMGDNRPNSRDSRFESVGLVEEDHMKGRAVFRLWPLDKFGILR